MLKKTLDTPSHEAVFIRQALEKDLRLDGRRLLDWRDTNVKLSRDESRSEADVSIGDTRVVVIVTGEIVKPFPDRPTEGILQFSADMCLAAENAGFNQAFVCRLVERSIKDSECIDLESLTLIAGEQVWSICCDIRVLSFHGNMIDATNFAVMSALRAYRKPEVSISLNEDKQSGSENSYTARSLKLYTSDEREPLPLALHHTPLTVSIGLFSTSVGTKSKGSEMGLVFLSDPSYQEEQAMDGLISFSVNSHSEICSIVKPGGIGMTLSATMHSSDLALQRAQELHSTLVAALRNLEVDAAEEQRRRLEGLRKLREARQLHEEAQLGLGGPGQVARGGDSADVGDGGLNLNDPILRYDYTHVTSGCTVTK